ncbi:hypothetical protein HMI55_001355 [Coelomomyces lativittatus]|nr:hypothetical protein HMI55_001355 [Coelomomyces lativittatus]
MSSSSLASSTSPKSDGLLFNSHSFQPTSTLPTKVVSQWLRHYRILARQFFYTTIDIVLQTPPLTSSLPTTTTTTTNAHAHAHAHATSPTPTPLTTTATLSPTTFSALSDHTEASSSSFTTTLTSTKKRLSSVSSHPSLPSSILQAIVECQNELNVAVQQLILHQQCHRLSQQLQTQLYHQENQITSFLLSLNHIEQQLENQLHQARNNLTDIQMHLQFK